MKKQDVKFTEVYEGLIFAENKSWNCSLNDKDIPLAYYIEIINMDDVTGEPEYKQYPYLVSISIVTSKPHKSFYEGDGKANKYSLMQDMVNYMGGVPIDHDLLSTDKLNKNITDELKAKDAKIVTHKQFYGTLAAQRGPSAEITYPQFKNYENAGAWAKELIKLYGGMHMLLCGFLLDRPINLMGETGWSVIERQVGGCQ